MKIPRRLEDPCWPGHFRIAAIVGMCGVAGAVWGIAMTRWANAIGTVNLVMILITFPVFVALEILVLVPHFKRRRRALNSLAARARLDGHQTFNLD